MISKAQVSRMRCTSANCIFAHESLDGVNRIGCVGHRLAFRDLSHQSLALVGKPDHAWRRATTFLVGHNLNRATLKDGDTAIRRA